MGLVDRLGFSYHDQNALQRGIVRFVSTDFGSWAGKRLTPLLDRFVFRITAGGNTATSWFAGLPLIWLETIGRKTGKVRRQPLLGFPLEQNLGLIGSNFGHPDHPGWALNLDSNPRARIEFEGKVVPVEARRASPVEVEQIWDMAAQRYPGYARYRERVTNREILLFVLEEPR
ncbi:MAG: nitroreductase family deazaflavin-dependent oxidoreductase [Acidimicrobiia bacterium]|nr:nitroreductase family deazaflavin-dependent oxidoreductase [Acidimicrobiia bacterium]